MLLSTMNNKEIVKEVLDDTEIIYSSSTISRLAHGHRVPIALNFPNAGTNLYQTKRI